MKYVKYIIFGAALLSYAGVPVKGQNKTDSVYTLEQCKALALENNAEIRVANNNLQAASEQRKEAFTKYFPEITAGASAFKTHHNVIEYDVLNLFSLGIINKGKTAGIWALQPVFAGGRIVNGNKLAKVGEEAARIRKEQ
ncbi:MAG: TolC family protein, partial [Paramuribaculum sp.]|nr:TolC family protein [Paramuribaculum sp.]